MHLHRQVLARAERTADAGEGDPDLTRRQGEARGDLVAVDVQPLGGDEQVDRRRPRRARRGPTPGPGRPGPACRPRRSPTDDDGSRRPGRGHVPAPDRHVPHEVAAGVHAFRALAQGRLGVADRRQRLVVDDDRGRRGTGGLRVVGGDDRDRLALVADLAEREHGLVGVLEAVGAPPRDVVGRQNRAHAGHPQRGGDVDAADPGPRVRAAGGRAPEHVLVPEVGGERELSRDLRRAVRARGGAADAAARASGLGDRHGWPARVSDAASAHGVQDLLVARAAAQVAGESLADLGV